ncbi:MAG: hypothetical protein GYA51_14475 [Candidatus Methanofastidiosa archaeon]|jgi:hypothetical protein|nr:hypothetical protein [Candidatus Methanofastidiosa archaeon]
MDYYAIVPSLLIGMFLGHIIVKRFKTPTNIVWFIILSFILINALIVVFDRYISSGYYQMDLIKRSVLYLLLGIYIYLIMLVLGIFNGSKVNNNPKNI